MAEPPGNNVHLVSFKSAFMMPSYGQKASGENLFFLPSTVCYSANTRLHGSFIELWVDEEGYGQLTPLDLTRIVTRISGSKKTQIRCTVLPYPVLRKPFSFFPGPCELSMSVKGPWPPHAKRPESLKSVFEVLGLILKAFGCLDEQTPVRFYAMLISVDERNSPLKIKNTRNDKM